MTDPLTMAVASAVAGKAAEAVTEQARQAVSAITGKIREKLRKRPADVEILDAAARGEPVVEPLAEILEREFEADPGFRDQVSTLWLQAAPSATDDAVSNVFHGKADKVIQLRDVHGDLNIS
ncbi:MAG: hypothetical protein J2P25_01005 [Nocardiopsaceae bacterium]|nr:hypothetical protein [Nocardiopsaceae bacterium]